MLNLIQVSVREWADYLETGVPPSGVPERIVKEYDKAITALRRANSYQELRRNGKFNPKPKNHPRKGYRAFNLTPQWRLLFKIERINDQTVVFIDEVSGDHTYKRRRP